MTEITANDRTPTPDEIERLSYYKALPALSVTMQSTRTETTSARDARRGSPYDSFEARVWETGTPLDPRTGESDPVGFRAMYPND